MKFIYNIVKADYLQRTRSYGFLIALAITVYGAYSFVPPPSANYTTLSMPGYMGVYNSAWVGYVSAMMTTVMVSMWGFFLINGGIKKDIDTEVGLIIATTRLSNLAYLWSKQLSNFLVLLSMAGIIFIMSIGMFFLRNDGYPFIFSNFILPYTFFAIPALFFVSALAVAGEVFLKKRQVLQFIAFIFLFGLSVSAAQQSTSANSATLLDVFGTKTMTGSVTRQVNEQFHAGIKGVSVGFTFNRHKHAFKSFEWNGITWTGFFLLSRLIWIFAGCLVVYFSSLFFHRFNLKDSPASKQRKRKIDQHQTETYVAPISIRLSSMPKVVPDFGIAPFIKTELLLMIRQGPRWIWLVVLALWLASVFTPLPVAYGIVLPVLWFLQVTRWSELATKEKTYRLHYFTYSSYKPLQRMLPAQILAGILLAIGLALPVIVRQIVALNGYAVFNILNGAVFVVLMAVCLGILSDGKKLFEVLFFLITYVIIDHGYIVDYLGALPHDNHLEYVLIILAVNVIFAASSFARRGYQARHL